MRVRDSSKVRGQRTHVSTLIQSNVYNIITYVYVYNACDCMCFLPCVYTMNVCYMVKTSDVLPCAHAHVVVCKSNNVIACMCVYICRVCVYVYVYICHICLCLYTCMNLVSVCPWVGVCE